MQKRLLAGKINKKLKMSSRLEQCLSDAQCDQTEKKLRQTLG